MATSSRRKSGKAMPTITAGDMLALLASTLKSLNGMRAVLEAMGAKTVLIKGGKTTRAKSTTALGGGGGDIVIGPIRIIAPHCPPPSASAGGRKRKAAKK